MLVSSLKHFACLQIQTLFSFHWKSDFFRNLTKKMDFRRIFVIVLWICIMNSVYSISNSTRVRRAVKKNVLSRTKRVLPALPIWFPYNTCIAVIIISDISLNSVLVFFLFFFLQNFNLSFSWQLFWLYH